MKTVRPHYDGRRYAVYLDDKTGEVIGYAVEVYARGRAPTERVLWWAADGKTMPQRCKDVCNVRGFAESVAYVMGW